MTTASVQDYLAHVSEYLAESFDAVAAQHLDLRYQEFVLVKEETSMGGLHKRLIVVLSYTTLHPSQCSSSDERVSG